jgi:flavin reductase
VALAADPTVDVPGEPWQVPKRYVHTLTKTRLFTAHQELVAAGLPSPFGDVEVADPDGLPFGTPDDQVTTIVDVSPWLPAKRAALLAHRSQIGEDSFFLNTPDQLATRVFGTEEFVLEEGTPGGGPGELEDDLFAGLSAVAGDPPIEFGELPVTVPASRHGGHDHWGVTGRADDVSAADRASTIDVDRFRTVLGRFVTGVTIMTTVADGVPHAMTASSVASVSLEPPLVLVCVDREAVMADHVRAGEVFALSMLADDQAGLSVTFADPSRPSGAAQFEGVATRTAVTGAPLIVGAVGWVDTRVWRIYDGGDHLIVLGEVVDLGHEPDKLPLAYHAGGYSDLELRS